MDPSCDTQEFYIFMNMQLVSGGKENRKKKKKKAPNSHLPWINKLIPLLHWRPPFRSGYLDSIKPWYITRYIRRA